MTFQELLELVVKGFEVLGVGILVAGSIAALATYVRDVREVERVVAYKRLRGNVGRTILLGLEVLIVADIVLTVAIDSTGRERDHARRDRPRPDLPELLAGDRARRRRPVAPVGGRTRPRGIRR